MDDRNADPDLARAFALAGELHTLVGKLKRRLREQAGAGDLTRAQVSVLLRLERDGPTTLTELARAEGMRSQSMGATVSALQAAALIESEPDPTDGRRSILSLTSACREWISDGRAARQDWLFRALREKLSIAEQEQVTAAVRLLNRLVDQ